jgi:hypothetical protein
LVLAGTRVFGAIAAADFAANSKRRIPAFQALSRPLASAGGDAKGTIEVRISTLWREQRHAAVTAFTR